jgi:hypothetical protein
VNLSKMGRRQEDKEDDPLTAQKPQHAQSKLCVIDVHSWKVGNESIIM